jgi:hypothetical protein
VKQLRKFGKFGKYWTTVVVSPSRTCSTDLMLNSGFAFSLSRPDNMPGLSWTLLSIGSGTWLALASLANASKKANGTGPTLDPAMARLWKCRAIAILK